MKKDWLNDIHNRMADFEANEPLGLWEDICSAESLAELSNNKKRNNNLNPWLWGSAAAAAFFVIVWTIFGGNPQKPATSNSMSEQLVSNNSTTENHLPEIKDDFGNYTTANSLASQPFVTRAKTLAEQIMTLPNVSHSDSTVSITETEVITGSEDSGFSTQPRPENNAVKTEKKYQFIAQKSKKASPEHRFTLSLSTSGGTGSANRQLFQDGYSAASSALNESEWVDSPMLGIMDLNRGIDTHKKVTHHIPLRTGLSVSYKLTDNISIGSGLTYAIVSSDINEGSNSHYVLGKQTLQYLGIPISLSYKLFSWKKIDFYLSADVLAEQCIKGESSKTYFINNKKQETKKSDINARPVQVSLGTKAGFQYNINPSLSLYAEPGVRYYFDDKSSLATVFSENELDFSLNMGIRLTLDK